MRNADTLTKQDVRDVDWTRCGLDEMWEDGAGVDVHFLITLILGQQISK